MFLQNYFSKLLKFILSNDTLLYLKANFLASVYHVTILFVNDHKYHSQMTSQTRPLSSYYYLKYADLNLPFVPGRKKHTFPSLIHVYGLFVDIQTVFPTCQIYWFWF